MLGREQRGAIVASDRAIENPSAGYWTGWTNASGERSRKVWTLSRSWLTLARLGSSRMTPVCVMLHSSA